MCVLLLVHVLVYEWVCVAHYILVGLGECVCEVACACIGVCVHTMEDKCISYKYCVFVYLYYISDVVREREINKRRKEKGKDEGEERKRKRIEKLSVTQKHTL